MSTDTARERWRRPLVTLFATLLALWAGAAAAEAPPLILQHLTASDGLPQGTVYAILQDSQGFVWLGTEDGLVRYDGHDLVRYAHSPGARGTLPGNFIHQVIEDTHHDLWVAVKDAGVARWNRASNDFTVFRHDASNPKSLASDAVRALLLDAHGRLWIGTSDAGIDILTPSNGHVEHLRHDAAAPDSLASNRILTLALDRSGEIWVGTDEGLERWLPGRHAFSPVGWQADPAGALTGQQISRVLEDRSGDRWIGTFDGGLDRLDSSGHLVQSFRHDPRQPDSLADDDVRAVLEDRAGRLWVGTASGLDLLDRTAGRFTHFRQDPVDADSLRDSFIMSLYEDDAGLIWIGTQSGGVSRWNPRSWELGGHRPGWMRDKLVTSFADGPDNKVWIGTLGGGLALFDADSGTTMTVDEVTGRPHSIGDPRVMSLRQDHKGNLWVGTMASGLRELLPGGRLRTISAMAGDPYSLSAPGIMTIFETRTGQLWIGTHGGGVNVLDPTTGRIRQLPFGSGTAGAVSAANVTAIAEDRDGSLWIGTDGGGLDLARADGTVVKVFRHDPHDTSGLPANTVYGLAVDAQNRVWVATGGGGLARVLGSAAHPGSISFQTLSREQGLSSDTIYGVVADAGGRIWLSGTAGLMRYDPRTGSVKTYHREDGLQAEEYDSLAYFRLRDGRICFGGPGGFNLFDPARLTESGSSPRLALTGVEVMGVPARSAIPYPQLHRVSVDYRANIVSLDFATLDFISPRRNRLEYRMDGLTDRWIDLGTQHRITLTNLDSGNHVLEVRAASSDSVWSETPLRLAVHRDPAPWKSPLAYAAYALAALGLILYRAHLQRARYRRVLAERQHLESEVALRTRELRETNRQLEEASQSRGRFFDRMSHELRTPMNGVVGMTELLMRTPLSVAQSRLTQTIGSSAQVLLQIVNDLLDLSKIDAGKVVLEEIPLALDAILEECTSLFAGAADAKGIDLIICPPTGEVPALLGDPLRIRQILMNLVGNAVKFTHRGEIVVRADLGSVEASRAQVRFSVADTGIGMDRSIVAKIFTPFTQADESTTRRFGGSGLGLAICRELAELMGGTIGVESQSQVGSTFQLVVPLKRAAVQSPRPAPRLPPHRVRIVTRRPALGEALRRHVLAFGLTVVSDTGVAVPPPGRDEDEVLLIDAAGGRDYVVQNAFTGNGSRCRAVVIAASRDVERLGLERLVAPEALVLNPVRQSALYESLATVLGVPPIVGETPAARPVDEPAVAGHVLLVEDEPVNAAVSEGYLATLGCTCVWVKDGPEAIARNAAERFDLILMDVNMPTMDGFAATALIRQQMGATRRIPIIALTAHNAASFRDACLRGGMDDMLSKPCTLAACAAVLRRWLPAPAATQDGRLAGRKAREAQESECDVLGAVVRGTRGSPCEEVTEGAVEWPDQALLQRLSKVDTVVVDRLRTVGAAGQPALFPRLVDLFHTGSRDALQKLRDTLLSGDLQAAAAICHKLASSAANVGALAFADHVRQLEQSCKNCDATRTGTLFARLQGAYPRLIDELSGLRLRESA